MARSARPLVLALFATLGCSDDPDPSGGGTRPAFVIEDPGAGAPNAEPLFPMHAGARRVFDTGQTTYVLDTSDRWGTTTFRYQVRGRGGQDDDLRFFRETEDGVVYDGSVRVLGKLPRPILLVPREVREGMRWTIPASEGAAALGTFTVTRRGDRSLFGTRPVWRITQKNDVTGTEVYTDYVEGRGAILATDKGANEARLRSAVIPLDAAEVRPPPPRVAVTPVDGGKSLLAADSLWPDEVSLIAPPNGPAQVRLGGTYAWYSNTGFSAGYVFSPAVVCLPFANGSFGEASRAEYSEGTVDLDKPCPRATLANVDPSGTVAVVSESAREANDRYGAPFVGPGGQRMAIGRRATDGGLTANVIWHFGWPNEPAPVEQGHLGSVDIPWRAAGELRAILSAQTSVTDNLAFALQLGEHLFFGRANLADPLFGAASSLAPGGSLGGVRLSTRLDAQGRVFLATARDGRVMRVDIKGDGVERKLVGELALPDKHELVGAFPFEGGLLAITQVGREDFDTLSKLPPKLGTIHAFRAAIDPLAATDVAPSLPALDLVVSRTARDARVCRPGGELTLDDATLGGQPASVQPLEHGCVLLLRSDASVDLKAEDAWLIEARVAGAGRVAIASFAEPRTDTLVRDDLFLEHAEHAIGALKSGGFTGDALRYTRGLTAIGTPPHAQLFDTRTVSPSVADAGGYGVWRIENIDYRDAPCPNGWTKCRRLRRWGDEYAETLVPGERIAAPLQGGGVLVTPINLLATPSSLVAPDGRVTELPTVESTPTEASQFVYFAGKSDGTACGYRQQQPVQHQYVHRYFCRTPGGVVRLATEDVTTGLVGSALLPGPGGFYGIGDASVFFDEVALATRPIELPAFETGPDSMLTMVPAHTAAGELFVQVHDVTEVRTVGLLRFADGAAHALPVPPAVGGSLRGIDVFQPQLKLLVDDAFFTFWDAASTKRQVVRVRR